MIINTSTAKYTQIHTTSEGVSKATSPQPVQASGEIPAASGQTTISGMGLLMSRLFGDSDSNPPVQTQLTKDTMGMSSVNFLTNNDRYTLAGLYAQAQQKGTDLRYVDDLARDLGDYRMFSGVMANLNNGNMYDNSGHVLTYKFTAEDEATASRILNGGKISGSTLDEGFLRYELDAGYSPTHSANFKFIESIVNQSGQNSADMEQVSDMQFSVYQQKGNQNFIVEAASEVTLKTPEPDFGSVNGKFFVTATGLKNGFRLEGGKVVQHPVDVLQNQSKMPKTLLDYFLKADGSNKKTTDLPQILLNFLYATDSSGANDK
ncbi:hypothetical protein [Kosakonia sacchari]|uniref:hypothetical protein n=1 Tax=Kosakonia sacchari TaxID=1158459 RepID=UPI001584E6B4|nr:hypothetical protein [Kosakonia sacchari]NUL38306.1 hypothetical protein [Kosakonia sacchari]